MQYLIPPWKHQLECIERAATLQEFALFFQMGSGKTSTTINILRNKFMQHKSILRTLVLCPVVVVENWKREFKMHSKVGNSVLVLDGPGKKKAEQIANAANGKWEILVTNYESLQNDEVFAALLKFNPQVLICDESQRLKNIKAVRTKKTITLADRALYRYILSGSPILNSPMDIFSQYRVLDKGQTFGTNFFVFRARYFYDKNAGMPTQKHFPDWRPLPGIEKVFNEMIYRRAMRVLKKDCMDLPPMIRVRHHIELTAEQRKAYKEMAKECIAFLDPKVTTAEIALTKTLRLMQIVSGFVKLTDDSIYRFDSNPKREALKELLEDLTPEHKVIVWATFRNNYETIEGVCNELGIKFSRLVGGITQSERQLAVDNFQTDPNVRVIIANQAAGGVGVNLTSASYSIFYSRDFSLENDMQAEARNYRGGSDVHEKITRIDLVAKDTIDEHVLECLLRKENVAHDILKVRAMLSE